MKRKTTTIAEARVDFFNGHWGFFIEVLKSGKIGRSIFVGQEVVATDSPDGSHYVNRKQHYKIIAEHTPSGLKAIEAFPIAV